MSGEEDLYLNRTETEALFFPDVLLDNADELDFGSFGEASGLDDGTFNSITGSSLSSFETRDIFKPASLNGDSFVDEIEAKCESNLIVPQEATANGATYSNGTLHNNYNFSKPTLDLESMGMGYGISSLYLQGNGVTGMGSPSSPSISQSGLISPSVMASEKLNGLTVGQMAPSYGPSSFDAKTTSSMGYPPGMSYSSARAMSVNAEMKQFLSSPQATPVTQVVTLQPVASMPSRFGSQDMLLPAAERNGHQSSSPVLSPNSSDGKDQVERLVGGEAGIKTSQEKQYYSMNQRGVMQQDKGLDTASFVDDQVDGDGDGLQPLPQMTRPSMQRSFSSHALGQLRHMNSAPSPSGNGSASRHSQMDRSGELPSPGARLQPSIAEFQSVGMRPMMRRVYSAGDIQTLNGMQGGLSGGGSPSFEDSNYRVGKYSMEERKIRIHRYQQKRSQRNFNKKIKYACRKTLADSRPRVRGRFAKNMDDDLPTALLGRKREEYDDEEVDGHAGEVNGYLLDNSSVQYSAMFTPIKFEHRTVNSM
ncbi:uncharacterized protein [Physcomitrium patens]|uniref:CCT domain-containing protein n=1 Tax=Physcomitrium patens TaxID=3218 RepID=A0A2K1KMG5_PHYPA|nr:uncharacterized protein LOC112281635 [Physcomitrium patens]XP_024374153.1 uncharacterized protein LOC112281635 [Physcomitrium patens]PNR54969.1 hypothetical protein PHYPA_005862 [Physcomitrium patens]|eukprot:XP_024374151.1 uncharacterized protein LOC112281635 [Physcomitrella patens]